MAWPFKKVNNLIYKKTDLKPIWASNFFKPERDRIYRLANFKTYVATNGNLIILRSIENGQDTIVQKYFNIQDAIRAQTHILEGYFGKGSGGELDMLFRSGMALDEAQELFLLGFEADSAEMEEIDRKLNRVLDDLENCKNTLKTEAKAQVNEIVAYTDCLGRKNPGVLAARTVASSSRLEKREDEIMRIIGYTTDLRSVLEKEIIFHTKYILRASENIRRMINSSDKFLLGHAFGNTVNKTLHFLQKIFINPYKWPADRAIKKLEEAKRIIRPIRKAKTGQDATIPDTSEARKLIKEAFHLLKELK